MCETYFYPSLTGEEDPRWIKKCQRTAKLDLTSVLTALEKDELDKLMVNPDGITLSIKRDIDLIEKWVDGTLYPSLCRMKTSHTKFKLTDRLTTLISRMRDVRNLSRGNAITTKVTQRDQKQIFKNLYVCNICDEQINVSRHDVLFGIECHSHLADKFAGKELANMEEELLEVVDTPENVEDVTEKLTKLQIENDDTSESSTSSTNSNQAMYSSNQSSEIPKLDSSEDLSISTNNSSKSGFDDVTDVLYPKSLMERLFVSQESTVVTIQSFKPSGYRCLTCHKEYYNVHDVLRHVKQTEHQDLLHAKFIEKLIRYHQTFSTLSNNLYYHQIYFIPAHINGLMCKVCRTYVGEMVQNVLQHIYGHKHRNLLMSYKGFRKYHFYEEIVHTLYEPRRTPKINAENDIPETVIPEKKQNVPRRPPKINVENDFPKTIITGEKKILPRQPPKINDIPETIIINANKNLPHSSKNISNGPKKENNEEKRIKKKFEKKTFKEKPKAGKDIIDDKTELKPKDDKEKKVDEPPIKKEHNVIPSLLENPENLCESLELRFQNHSQLFEQEGNSLFCTLCKLKFNAVKEDLRAHVTTVAHLRQARKELPRRRWLYYCDLCLKTENDEPKWTEHINSIAHKQRHDTLNQSTLKGGPFMEYQCEECWVIIYGNTFSVAKHIKEPVTRSRKKKKEYKLSAAMEKLLKNERSLEDKIMRLTKESDRTLELQHLNRECCKAIESVIQTIYPACRALPFGSRVSGIGCLNSDLDVFVDIGMMYNGTLYQDSESQANFVRQVMRVFRRHHDFTDLNAIPQARTPIVQVFHKVTGIDCDLSFRHGLSVENTEFLRLCIDVQPALKPLILILKYWLQQCNFDRISTYALSMMCIFFMQIKFYLPSVKKLRELDPTPCRIIAGWTTFRFTKPLEVIINSVQPCTISPRQLMIDFFKYYSDFKYDTDVVCPLLGRTILKTDFNEEKGLNLPPEMASYVQKIMSDEQNERFRYLSPMGIQDPFDLSHNLTKACPMDYVNRFTTLCLSSYKILTGTYEPTPKEMHKINACITDSE